MVCSTPVAGGRERAACRTAGRPGAGRFSPKRRLASSALRPSFLESRRRSSRRPSARSRRACAGSRRTAPPRSSSPPLRRRRISFAARASAAAGGVAGHRQGARGSAEAKPGPRARARVPGRGTDRRWRGAAGYRCANAARGGAARGVRSSGEQPTRQNFSACADCWSTASRRKEPCRSSPGRCRSGTTCGRRCSPIRLWPSWAQTVRCRRLGAMRLWWSDPRPKRPRGGGGTRPRRCPAAAGSVR